MNILPVNRLSQFCAILLLAMVAALPASPARAEQTFSVGEIEYALTAERNMMSYNRLSGLLTDLLRVQKRIFRERGNKGEDMVAAKAEELVNEAGLHASQSEHDKSFALLRQAYDLLVGSLGKMGITPHHH